MVTSEERARRWLEPASGGVDPRFRKRWLELNFDSLAAEFDAVREDMKVEAAEHALKKGVEALDAAVRHGARERDAEVERIVREVDDLFDPAINWTCNEILRRLKEQP